MTKGGRETASEDRGEEKGQPVKTGGEEKEQLVKTGERERNSW